MQEAGVAQPVRHSGLLVLIRQIVGMFAAVWATAQDNGHTIVRSRHSQRIPTSSARWLSFGASAPENPVVTTFGTLLHLETTLVAGVGGMGGALDKIAQVIDERGVRRVMVVVGVEKGERARPGGG